MTSKERVLTTFSCQEADRVPVDYDCNPGIDARLKAHFGLPADDYEGLKQALGVDFRGVGAPYVGPRLHAELPDRAVNGLWGWHCRWVEHETGGYWDYCDFPLRDADEETIAAWPFPSPDDFDYSGVRDGLHALCRLRRLRRRSRPRLHHQHHGLSLWHGASARGPHHRRARPAPPDRPHARHSTGNNAPHARSGERRDRFHLDRRRPRLPASLPSSAPPSCASTSSPATNASSTSVARYDIPVMMHTCGSSSWAYEDYIAMGLKVVDTLQPEAKDMDPAYSQGPLRRPPRLPRLHLHRRPGRLRHRGRRDRLLPQHPRRS